MLEIGPNLLDLTQQLLVLIGFLGFIWIIFN